MPFTYRKTESKSSMSGVCSPPLGVRRRAGIGVALLTLGACTPPVVHSGSSGVASLVASRTGWRPEWNDDSVALRLRIPAGSLEPDSAARLAVLRSPRVRVTLADVGIAAADLWQASLLPNPLASYSYGFPPSGSPFVSAGLGFAIVDALKIPLRKRVAEAAFAATEQRVADAVIGITLDAQRAYTLVQHAQQMLELRMNIVSATSAAALAAQGLREAGNVPALLLAGERSMAAQSELDVAQAEGDLATARADLGRLLGAGVADTAWTIPDLLRTIPKQAFVLATLDSLALTRRLDVAAARESIRSSAAVLGLTTQFRLLDDGTIGVLSDREPDGHAIGPSLSVPIPLFDQRQAARARAQAMLRQRIAMHDAIVVDVHADVRARLAQLRAAAERATRLRTSVLPLRQLVVAETQKHVNAMDVSVFALLQAKQAEIEAGKSYVDALRDYWVARIELERATGGRLPMQELP
jgi:cobalt-zinc-cadmium efflux system outer membrane protein